MADGSVIVGGDTITDEDLGDATVTGTGRRGVSGLPTTTYKVPRSKIAVGPYGTDQGDASPENPLSVQTAQERRRLEEEAVRAIDAGSVSLRRMDRERLTLCDNRGSLLSHRGRR